MTDSKKLHLEAAKLRQKILTRVEEAERAILRAESWTRAGDFNKASYENTIANKDYKEVIKMSQEAIEYDHQATELEIKAWEVELQQNELQSSTQYKIDQLERQKRTLRGE